MNATPSSNKELGIPYHYKSKFAKENGRKFIESVYEECMVE